MATGGCGNEYWRGCGNSCLEGPDPEQNNTTFMPMIYVLEGAIIINNMQLKVL
jgi:hypothetical protein